jgi:RNA polymerase sigma-70 factor (ECF subfamily)
VEQSDGALMARLVERDRDAFHVLVERHGDRPYRVAWRMLGDQSEAEDVAQEALLRLWDLGAGWKDRPGGVPAWLARVATNLCLDRIRRRKFDSGEEPPERVDETPLADVMIETRQVQSLAATAVKALPEKQRAAIILTYYEEFSNQMAADALDLNLKAFESLLHRARAALRVAMAPYVGDVK